MEIIAHRGWWNVPKEKNTVQAILRAFQNGMGIETDIRDSVQKLVISHDMAKEESLAVEQVFQIYKNSDFILAVNIKADGLQVALKKLIDTYKISNYFCFDMSVPDTFGYIKEGLKFFVRESEYEVRNETLYQKADGIWMDSFTDKKFVTEEKISGHRENGKKVCIVSPELHGRDCESEWAVYKKRCFLEDPNIILCTDFPEKARRYFYG